MLYNLVNVNIELIFVLSNLYVLFNLKIGVAKYTGFNCACRHPSDLWLAKLEASQIISKKEKKNYMEPVI